MTSKCSHKYGQIKRAKMALYRSPDYLTSFELIGLSVQDKKLNKDFQDGSQGCRFGFTIRTILDISDLQVAPILSNKFRIQWPFFSDEETQN